MIVQQDEDGEKRLVGYVVGRAGAELSQSRLRKTLEEKLPEYMVPGMIVILKEMPLTPNGKIRRAALPKYHYDAEARYVAPRTPLEKQLAQIWSELLHRDRPGVFDNFFARGGHSLMAMRLRALVHREFHYDLSLVSI